MSIKRPENYRVGQKSKLLILSKYVNKTENTGGVWTSTNSYRENEALSDIFTWNILRHNSTIVFCLNILWLKAVNDVTARQTRTRLRKRDVIKVCSTNYLTTQIELALPTFKSWTVHKIKEYLTWWPLFSLRNIYHITTAYFLTHPVYANVLFVATISGGLTGEDAAGCSCSAGDVAQALVGDCSACRDEAVRLTCEIQLSDHHWLGYLSAPGPRTQVPIHRHFTRRPTCGEGHTRSCS